MVARRFRRLLVPLIILLVIIASVVGLQHLFVVRTIDCRMDDQPCTDPVMAELARLRGKSMFFVETADLQEKLHAALPKSQTIAFEKKPPQTMQVFITSYPSAFIIHSGAQYLLANQGGTLIELVESFPQTELDVVVPNANMQVGETIDAPIFSALLQLTSELKKSSLVVLSVEYIDENQIVLRLLDNKTAYLKTDGIPDQLTTLQRLVNDATMTARGHIFDVRFAHPVVKTEPQGTDGKEQNNLGN